MNIVILLGRDRQREIYTYIYIYIHIYIYGDYIGNVTSIHSPLSNPAKKSRAMLRSLCVARAAKQLRSEVWVIRTDFEVKVIVVVTMLKMKGLGFMTIVTYVFPCEIVRFPILRVAVIQM